jgi:hypothetical protein
LNDVASRDGGSRTRTCERLRRLRASNALPFPARPCLQRKEGESNPQGPETHPFSRRDTAPVAVLPRGDSGRPRTCTSPGKNRELCPLELRSRDVTGRDRTCDAPRFRRALYRAELRPRVSGMESSARPRSGPADFSDLCPARVPLRRIRRPAHKSSARPRSGPADFRDLCAARDPLLRTPRLRREIAEAELRPRVNGISARPRSGPADFRDLARRGIRSADPTPCAER